MSTFSLSGVVEPFYLLGGYFFGLPGSDPFLPFFFGYTFAVSGVGVPSLLRSAFAVSIAGGFFFSFKGFFPFGLSGSSSESDSFSDLLEFPSSERISSLLGLADIGNVYF